MICLCLIILYYWWEWIVITIICYINGFNLNKCHYNDTIISPDNDPIMYGLEIFITFISFVGCAQAWQSHKFYCICHIWVCSKSNFPIIVYNMFSWIWSWPRVAYVAVTMCIKTVKPGFLSSWLCRGSHVWKTHIEMWPTFTEPSELSGFQLCCHWWGACRYDNHRCCQWLQSWHHENSVYNDGLHWTGFAWSIKGDKYSE